MDSWTYSTVGEDPREQQNSQDERNCPSGGQLQLLYEGGLSETDAQIGTSKGPTPSRVFRQEGQQLH